MKFILFQIVKNTKIKLKKCYKKMKFFKFHNTNPLRILANGFLVKFE